VFPRRAAISRSLYLHGQNRVLRRRGIQHERERIFDQMMSVESLSQCPLLIFNVKNRKFLDIKLVIRLEINSIIHLLTLDLRFLYVTIYSKAKLFYGDTK